MTKHRFLAVPRLVHRFQMMKHKNRSVQYVLYSTVTLACENLAVQYSAVYQPSTINPCDSLAYDQSAACREYVT